MVPFACEISIAMDMQQGLQLMGFRTRSLERELEQEINKVSAMGRNNRQAISAP